MINPYYLVSNVEHKKYIRQNVQVAVFQTMKLNGFMIKKVYNTPGLLKLLNNTVYMPKYNIFKVRVNEALNLTSACVIIITSNIICSCKSHDRL